MSNFQRILIIVVLCVAVLFISGILLPRYLSLQILELRSELQSQDNSKYSLRANSDPVASKLSQDAMNDSTSNQDVKANEMSQNELALTSKSPVKVKRRSKRQVKTRDGHYKWNFHFNLTQQDILHERTETKSNFSHKDNLGISIYTEGEGNGKRASADIQHTLGSADYYFRELFKHIENRTEEDTKNEFAHSEKIKPDFLTVDVEGSGDEPLRAREGKFFNLGSLSIFGFGKHPKKNIVSSTISTMPETDSAFIKEDIVTTTESPQTPIFTEKSRDVPNLPQFQAQSLVSETLSLVNNTPGSNLPGKTEDGECIDCNAIGFEVPLTSSTESLAKNDSSEAVDGSEFSDEFLEMLCMRLVNKVGESQHLSNTEDLIVDPKQNNPAIIKSPENPNFGLPSSASEKELNLDFVTENFLFLVSSDKSDTELRQRFISLSDLLAVFGSGRAAADQDDSNELQAFADVDLVKLPTLLDCESYFRKKNTKMFAKPNLMDMLSDPNIQLADFANTTVSSKLTEQQLQFLTDLPKTNLDNSVETFGKNSDVVTKPISGETMYGNDESTINVLPEEIVAHTEPNYLNWKTDLFTRTEIREVESTTELQRERFFGIFGSGNGESRSLGTESFDRNEIFGSGEMGSLGDAGFTTGNKFRNGESRSLETAKLDVENEFGSVDSRFFWTSLFGSGDSRTLEDVTFGIERDNFGSGDSRTLEDVTFGIERDNFGSGNSRFFGSKDFSIERNVIGSGDFESEAFSIDKNDFGSGDLFQETVTDLYENLSSISPNKERFFGLLGLTGSGDGRDLSENLEFSHIEIKCQSNCSLAIATEQPNDCDGYGCDYGKTNESNVNLLDHDLQYEKGCHKNCLDNSSADTGKFDSNFTILMDKNLTDEGFKRPFTYNQSFEDVAFSPPFLKNESGMLNESLQECHDCNIKDLKEIDKVLTEENEELSKCGDCTECNSSIRCNTNISHIADESQAVLPNELTVIGTKETNEKEATSSNTTSVNVNHTDVEIVYPKAQNVIESPNEQSTESTQRFFGTMLLTGSGDGAPINLLEEDTSIRDQPYAKNMASSAEDIIETLNDHTTEKNTKRFLETMFLTGSGDKGLFEDGGGPINLIQEEDNTSQNFSLRQSRLDDIPFNFSEELNGNSLRQSKQGHTIDNTATKQFTSPVTPIRRRGRVDDTLDDLCDNCDYDYDDFIENYLRNKNLEHDLNKADNFDLNKKIGTQFYSEMPITNEKKKVAVSSEVTPSNNQIFGDQTKKFRLYPCTAARECNATLNERCITMNSSRVCGCSRGYARNKETRKCIIKKVVETTIKLPAENFEDDLENPFSPSFQEKRKSSIDMVKLLLQNDPELLRILTDIQIVKFSAGSLVITANLVFAVENKSEAQLVKNVEDDIQVALRDEKLMNSVSLDISEASLLSVNGEIDYCKSSEFNYCSEHANCVSNAAIPGSYACHCKEHYRDVSFDPSRMGEACLAKCPKEYCGRYGHCELLANDERLCLCSGLYFGRRCEVPGLYVLIILGFVGFVSLTMLLLVVFKKRCSRFSYNQAQAQSTEENEAPSHMNGRVSDVIALEENIGTRFANISTPKQPAIQITRPTVTESGASYDYDSTFDSTQSASKTDEDSTV